MHAIFSLVAGLVGIISLICWVLILIEAFQDELWKGFVGLLCGLYLLYYALFEFEHENKWLIVIGAFGGGAIAAGIRGLA